MKKQLLTIFGCLLLTGSMAQTQRLSPRPEEVISLNGVWQLQGRYPVKVPGELVMQGFNIDEGETAVYSLPLSIPAHWKNKRIKIRFDAASSHALVKVNGITVGEHEGGFVPFELDITKALHGANDTLTVAIQTLTVSDYLACASQYAVHHVAGLLRKVTMFAVPEVNLADIRLNTTFDKQYKNGTLQINTSIANESAAAANAVIRYTLTDANGHVVFQHSENPEGTVNANSTAAVKSTIAVRSPKKWSAEQPYLYTLQTDLIRDKQIVESNTAKVGFREVQVKGNELLVNGRPVKLRGVCKHDTHPLSGRSVSPQLTREDAQLFRDANCNYIRTSHYPPSEEFLQAADSLGLFVESEAAITWVQHGASPIWKLWDYKDEKFLPYMIQANADNIQAGKNHPSVIIWSLGNESLWSPLWEKVQAFVKATDPHRPTTFHDQCWGGFNNANSKADIAVYHYPGINGPAKAAGSTRPVLFGEYAHLSCYNRRELLTDPGIRSAYNAPLVTFYDSIYHYKGCLGGAIWSGIDDIFHLPDGQIAGYGPWGPIDGWRRPKPEYTGVKRAYSPVRVTKVTEEGAYYELTVENRYDQLSFADLKITAGEQHLSSAILPGKTGKLKVPKSTEGTVHLTFTDPRGFVCAEELLGIKPPASPAPRNYRVTVTENAGAVFVQQGPYSYTISKTKGIITSIRKGNDTLMNQGPVFSVVPINSEDGGKPNVAGETYQNNIYPLKNYPLYTLFAQHLQTRQLPEGVRIDMDVTYTDGKGKQSYLITPGGDLITTYSLTYKGNDTLPYQYGLIMELPASFNQLTWVRKGEFSCYDSTDIARTAGTAYMNSRYIQGVEEHGVQPAGSWKDDANELGTNDFRSTKRNVYQAALSNKNGHSVRILADGHQHSRSWLQDATVHWLLADYTNNGSEPFYGTPHSDGRINIKNKTLEGKLTISLP
ncbi:glycoside hydrolase family 2 protein [Chitinophaga sp. RCC_12]|uniref:glycoside hydrolase family 2 protein n=1 Tax=Chitinophaga sp. RCC_12 TaxID=3239226 RepID=UPI003523A4EF